MLMRAIHIIYGYRPEFRLVAEKYLFNEQHGSHQSNGQNQLKPPFPHSPGLRRVKKLSKVIEKGCGINIKLHDYVTGWGCDVRGGERNRYCGVWYTPGRNEPEGQRGRRKILANSHEFRPKLNAIVHQRKWCPSQNNVYVSVCACAAGWLRLQCILCSVNNALM